MELAIVILVYICGLAAVLVELMVPGMIMGTIGLLAVLASIVYALTTGHTLAGGVLICLTVALIPLFFMLWKGIMGRYFALRSDEKGFRASSTVSEELVGAGGVTVTALRPSGIARIDNRRCAVVTQGEMLDKGVQIKVIDVSGNRVVVRKA